MLTPLYTNGIEPMPTMSKKKI